MGEKRVMPTAKDTNKSGRPSPASQECHVVEQLLMQKDSQAQKDAIPLLRKAANDGDPWAQYSLGLAYQEGIGVRKNIGHAQKWYQLSANQGYDSALLNLGKLIANRGNHSYEKYAQALKLFRRAARRGNRNAMYNMGLYYEYGRGVTKNLRRSFHWYIKAAQLGDSDAQCHVGYCYHEGEGVRRNEQEALRWYRQSAKDGNASAMYNIGLCFYFGDGIRQNGRQARYWFKKAADNGNDDAVAMLNEMTETKKVNSTRK